MWMVAQSRPAEGCVCLQKGCADSGCRPEPGLVVHALLLGILENEQLEDAILIAPVEIAMD